MSDKAERKKFILASARYFAKVGMITSELGVDEANPGFHSWWMKKTREWVKEDTSEVDRIGISSDALEKISHGIAHSQSGLVGQFMLTVTQLAVTVMYQGKGGFAVQMIILLRLAVIFVQKPGESWEGMLAEMIMLLAAYVLKPSEFAVMFVFAVFRMVLPSVTNAVIQMNHRIRSGRWTDLHPTKIWSKTVNELEEAQEKDGS